jgi:DNA-binding NarL/FixJ family response regulator
LERRFVEGIDPLTSKEQSTRKSFALQDTLTAREVEVLRLLATGLTNHQIAEQLFVSQTTINAHLRNIYGKLGVSSRLAAARFAMENSLV